MYSGAYLAEDVKHSKWDVVVTQDGRENLLGSREASTGVYVGCVWQEYQVLLEHLHVTPTAAVLTGSGINFMIGRVSYTLGLQGVVQTSPSIVHAYFSGGPTSPECQLTTCCGRLQLSYWQ